MRKIVLVAACLTLMTSIISCKESSPNNEVVPEDITNKQDTEIANISKTEALVQQIITETNNTKKSLTKSNAVATYKAFREKIEGLTGEINTENTFLTDSFYQYYNQETNKMVYPDSLQTKIKHFDSAKIELWDIGEGMAVIRVKPDFYTSIFNKYLPDDYKEYLQLEAEDESVLWAADAGVIIDWKDLSERVLHWDQFLTKYPASPLFKDARELYQSYLNAYLLGSDNSPVITDDGKEFYTEIKQEFDRFIEKNPETNTTKIMKAYLENWSTIGQDKLYNFVDKEQSKYFIQNNK